jgi:hypothetical protein
MSVASRNRLAHVGVVIAVVIGLAAGCGVSAASASPSPPLWLTRFKAAPAPAGWLLLVPPSGTSSLWYPPIMRPIKGDTYSVSAALRDRTGTILVYLNGGPKTGNPQMRAWPSFRLDHLREDRNRLVHEEAHASALAFRGGRGSCVIDDYVTRLADHHYREIACFVQGRSTASVIVAAALVNMWPTYGPLLEGAVEAWEVR